MYIIPERKGSGAIRAVSEAERLDCDTDNIGRGACRDSGKSVRAFRQPSKPEVIGSHRRDVRVRKLKISSMFRPPVRRNCPPVLHGKIRAVYAGLKLSSRDKPGDVVRVFAKACCYIYNSASAVRESRQRDPGGFFRYPARESKHYVCTATVASAVPCGLPA